MKLRDLCAVGLVVTLFARPALAQTTQDLKRMTLEQLLELDVTTVSRVPENTLVVPAALFVITGDDIRRSGARSIPEALRLAPGLQVARINGGTWAIGTRGFADRLARSMLVLIDGRAVYSPLFAGTYWEAQDYLLDDIDRIEVIRGPGGTLWGANAVNGIINIITKPAAETQGVLAGAGGGTEERGFGFLRYGGTAGAVSYRAYAKGFDRDGGFHADGNEFDGMRMGQAGFRADWTLANARSLTLQGDAYVARLGQRPTFSFFTAPFSETRNLDAPISGGNVMMRFAGRAGAAGEYRVQTYYDHTHRREIPVVQTRDTFDVDFQSTLGLANRHVFTWGAGYRVTSGRNDTLALTVFTPMDRTDHLYSAFAQDELSLVPNRWRLTLGVKLEHNDYSGLEAQPSARVLWTPHARHTLFGAVTRAVRTPSAVETDYSTVSLVSASPTLTFVRLLSNPGFLPEKLVAYELGYRSQPTARLYVTVSGFYKVLEDLLSTELLTPFEETDPPPARMILPVQLANTLDGHGQGVELTADLRVVPWWRMTGGYSYLTITATRKAGSRDLTQENTYEGRIPHHQAQLGASFDVQERLQLDWFARHVSGLSSVSIPGYTTSNVRAAWQATPELELAVVGQDLHRDHHFEWSGDVGVQRSVYVRFTWRGSERMPVP